MAGRGRGRGRGSTLSFNLDALGVQRGEIFSGPVNQPPPLFPPLPRNPIPDTSYEASDLKLLEIRREMRTRYRQRSAFLTLEEKKRDIERYSDKYQLIQQDEQTWTPDWSQFPDELQPSKARKRKKPIVAPNLKAARTSKSISRDDILKRAKERLGTDSTDNAIREEDEDEKKEDEDEEEGKEEGEEEEEELDEEEETDYNLTYFDNGENYGDDEEEDDEPAYS